MSTILDLYERKGKAVHAARDLVERAEKEDREMSAEENTTYESHLKDIESLESRIAKQAKSDELSKAESESRGRVVGPAASAGEVAATVAPEVEQRAMAKKGFGRWLRGANAFSEAEQRALAMDLDTAGGYLVPPQDFVASLIQFVNDNVWMRQFATVRTVTNAESLGVPTLDTDPSDPAWTAEIATGSADSAMVVGKRDLHPHPLAKQISVSNKLIRASAIDVEALVLERLAYKFGIAAEKAYLTGSGANQPLGVFTATADGIDTGRDVSTGNSTTAIAADGLIEAKFKLKENYWGRLRWLFHRDALKQIFKLKDGNGQYLWRMGGLGQGLNESLPGTLLDVPVYLSEYAPNTFTTGLYVGIIGDFSRYWIADALSMQFQRLIEVDAKTNQTTYIGRLESDGMPVLAEAFARVKLA